MQRSVHFCRACGARLDEHDATCPCCGAVTIEANVIRLLRRTPLPRARRHGVDGETDGDDASEFI